MRSELGSGMVFGKQQGSEQNAWVSLSQVQLCDAADRHHGGGGGHTTLLRWKPATSESRRWRIAGDTSDLRTLSCNNTYGRGQWARVWAVYRNRSNARIALFMTYHSEAGRQCCRRGCRSPVRTVWTSAVWQDWPQECDLQTQNGMLKLNPESTNSTQSAPPPPQGHTTPAAVVWLIADLL